MSVEEFEHSLESSNPVELYEFRNGNFTWRYTSADTADDHDGETYTPERIQRTQLGDTIEQEKMAITITVPVENPIAELFRFYPPTSVTTVTIYRKQRFQEAAAIYWIGRVLNADHSTPNTDLHCEPASTSIKRLGLRRYYQRQCPHVLYGTQCGVDRTKHKTETTVVSYSGLAVKVAKTDLTVDRFSGGILEWDSTVLGTQYRFISANTADTLNINFPCLTEEDDMGRSLLSGTPVRIYPGCRHTLTDCINIFNNLPNFGGFPFIPFQNPFNMTTLW